MVVVSRSEPKALTRHGHALDQASIIGFLKDDLLPTRRLEIHGLVAEFIRKFAKLRSGHRFDDKPPNPSKLWELYGLPNRSAVPKLSDVVDDQVMQRRLPPMLLPQLPSLASVASLGHPIPTLRQHFFLTPIPR